MATRAATLDPRHVEALNQIDVVFSGKSKSEGEIRSLWKQYLDHLGDKAYPRDGWGAKRVEMLVDLLHGMAQHLGFEFDKTHIKNQTYYPEGFGNLEGDQQAIRRSLVDILSGKKDFPVTITNLSSQQ